mmetsp:Transcript_11355/g.24937  ORF Transcript_11355/g.24937 Transcript_11355/m.24937 type:complete len:131 (+) Transcript_11355:1773-2165(+)
MPGPGRLPVLLRRREPVEEEAAETEEMERPAGGGGGATGRDTDFTIWVVRVRVRPGGRERAVPEDLRAAAARRRYRVSGEEHQGGGAATVRAEGPAGERKRESACHVDLAEAFEKNWSDLAFLLSFDHNY